MSAGAVWLVCVAAVLSLGTGLLVALFAHRLNANEHAARSRDEDARTARDAIQEKLTQQSETIANMGQLLAVQSSQAGPIADRILIIESGQHNLDTANQLLRQQLQAHIQWTRDQLGLSRNTG